MKYEIKLRIDGNSPVEVVYEAIFLKEAICRDSHADSLHKKCLELGRNGAKLSDILTAMKEMVTALERDEDAGHRT
jgi:lipid A disaccharide synthetase